jgi:NAD(P)-dependent dehydrogenase (short-subunit alcohol dehydrogenase family)
MDLGLEGKVALVTGGATGLGLAIARGLSAEGARVFVTTRSDRRLEAIKDEFTAFGVCLDVSAEGGPAIAFEDCCDALGRPPDIIINNAGDTLGITDPHCSIEDWRRVMRLNLEVAVELNNLAIPHMKEKGWGRIVNVSSGASLENSGPSPYCAAKTALTAYSRSMGRVLATEAPGIVMTTLIPGVFVTEEGHWSKVLKERPEHADKYLSERCPLGRLGQPDEIVGMALLLCSNRASFMHAGVYPVDAGQARHYFNLPN